MRIKHMALRRALALFRFSLAAAALAAVLAPAAARAQSCTVNAAFSIEAYFDQSLPFSDARCTPGKVDASGLRCRAVLKGFLYVPKTAGKHPVIVWNHGSGQARLPTGVPGLSPDKPDLSKDSCVLARFFVNRGFIFFAPQRRGTGMSTGVYVSDWIERLENNESAEVADAMIGPKLLEQTEDVNEAVEFIGRAVAKADKNKIAVMGHSYGGMVSLFSAIKLKNIRAAIDSAGGALSWDGHPFLRRYLQVQTPFVGVPTLMIQDNRECAGDGSDPTRTLRSLLPHNGSHGNIYPVKWKPCGKTGAHRNFMQPEGISLWGDDVIAFLKAHGVAP